MGDEEGALESPSNDTVQWKHRGGVLQFMDVASEMGTRQLVVEEAWQLLAVSFVGGHSVRHKIPGAFLYKGRSAMGAMDKTRSQRRK